MNNYYKELDGKLWDFYETLGDTDLGDFDPDGQVYRKQTYELGEIPIAVLSEVTAFNLSKGMGNIRLHQLEHDGLISLRKTGRYKPTFVSILVEDHDEYFRRAGLSRQYWGQLRNPKNLAELVLDGPVVKPEQSRFDFEAATEAERFEFLDSFSDVLQLDSYFESVTHRWYHDDVSSFIARYAAHRGVA